MESRDAIGAAAGLHVQAVRLLGRDPRGHPVTEMLDDSPLNPPVRQLDSSLWQPKDYDDTTLGLIPMRQSLYMSRNLSTIKLGMALGSRP